MAVMDAQTEHSRAVEKARNAFFHNDSAPFDLLPTHVIDSWKRCRAIGLSSSDKPCLDPVSKPALRRLLDREPSFAHATSEEFETISGEFQDTGHIVYLIDDQGFIVSVGGDITHAGPVLRHAQLGVSLSESNFGTTAPASALIAQRPVAVHRGEHFFSNLQAMECIAVPIIQSSGTVIGALGVSSDYRPLMPGVTDLVQNSMAHIERRFLRRLRSAFILHLHPRLECIGTSLEGLVAFGEDREVLGLNTIAARFLGVAQDAAIGQPLEDLIENRLRIRAIQTDQPLMLRAKTRMNLFATLERTEDFKNLPVRRLRPIAVTRAGPGSQPGMLQPLTDQEIKILRYLETGYRNRDIGEALYISENTVKFHMKNIFSKLSVSNRLEAIAVARDLGLTL